MDKDIEIVSWHLLTTIVAWLEPYRNENSELSTFGHKSGRQFTLSA